MIDFPNHHPDSHMFSSSTQLQQERMWPNVLFLHMCLQACLTQLVIVQPYATHCHAAAAVAMVALIIWLQQPFHAQPLHVLHPGVKPLLLLGTALQRSHQPAEGAEPRPAATCRAIITFLKRGQEAHRVWGMSCHGKPQLQQQTEQARGRACQ
jgi:hypothetical protein